METLTLILHKSKETKNKVVYGTKRWQCHPERLYRQGRTGRRLASHDTGRPYPRSDPRDGLFDSLVADESHRVPHAAGGVSLAGRLSGCQHLLPDGIDYRIGKDLLQTTFAVRTMRVM